MAQAASEVRVLVGCERSGTVRDAFRALGHDAWSCDLSADFTNSPFHIEGDVLEFLDPWSWDLFIAHPPCTYLSFAGTAYWERPGRAALRLDALSFFLRLWEAPVPRIALENPLGIASAIIAKHDQVIEPFHFGDSERKRTCLWLKNLPPLIHVGAGDMFDDATRVPAPEPTYISKSGKRLYFTESLGGGEFERSVTFPGIAAAMALQWGALCPIIPSTS